MALDPLILTLALDDAAQGYFEALRQAHFPPARNVLAAHLTLFHHLPAEHHAALDADLATVCAEHGPMPITVSGLLFLGKGVAFSLDSPTLDAARGDLARRWWPWLGEQDRRRFRAHVTVQNKVDPPRAHALHEELRAGFAPFEVVGVGLHLWRYLGGPWESLAMYPFAGATRGGTGEQR